MPRKSRKPPQNQQNLRRGIKLNSGSECEHPSTTFHRPTRSNHDPDVDTYFYEDYTADEYDECSNVSTVRFNPEATKPITLSSIQDRMKDIVTTSTAPSTWGDWVLPAKMSGDIAKSQQMSDPPASFGLARAKLFTTGQLTRKKRQLRSGQSTPEDLRHDPVPHVMLTALGRGGQPAS